jgi:hypothetical protein
MGEGGVETSELGYDDAAVQIHVYQGNKRQISE